MSIPDLLFLRPTWLLGIPFAIAAGWYLARHSDDLGGWRDLIDRDLLIQMKARGHISVSDPGPDPWLMALSLGLLCAGLAGPASRDPDAPVLRNRDALMILADLSPSLAQGGGLGDAQTAMSRLIDRNAGRPIGLILYGGESFVASIPTEDPEVLQEMIAVLDADTLPVGGSRPDRALAMARDVLMDAAAISPDVVFVSDGGGMGPITENLARELASEGAHVSGILVRQKNAAYGAPPVDAEGMSNVVGAGGGRLVEARYPETVDELLASRRSVDVNLAAIRMFQYRDWGPWLAAMALLPLAFLFRRRRE